MIVKHCLQDFKTRFNIDLTTNARAKARLQNQVNHAKHQLSATMSTVIDVESLSGDNDYSLNMTRLEFEQLCAPIFQRCLPPLTEALTDANLAKSEIDEVVLVGGSTRIPKIQSMLTEYFDGKSLNKQLHPDEAVAYGATIQAGILSGVETAQVQDILLLDITPLSLGTDVKRNGVLHMSTIIPRNTAIPIEKTERYNTAADG